MTTIELTRNAAGNFEIAPAALKAMMDELSVVGDAIVSADWLCSQLPADSDTVGLVFALNSISKRQDDALGNVRNALWAALSVVPQGSAAVDSCGARGAIAARL